MNTFLTSLSFILPYAAGFFVAMLFFQIKTKLLEARKNYAVPSFTSDFMHAA